MARTIRNLLREPLVHFLLLGSVIFLAYSLLAKRGNNEPGKIIITQGQIAAMKDAFITTRQRQPSSEELAGMIRDRVREEVYYREALALGLDKDDIIIRRRLRQKIEFMADDAAAQAEPSEAELSDFMNRHPELFHAEPQFSFRQVFLNVEQRSKTMKQDVSEFLSELNKPDAKYDIRKMGDASLLPSSMTDARITDVTNQFGEEFANQITQLPVEKWVGPVSSAYGVHLVWVGKRTAGGMPEFARVQKDVRREWEEARRKEANEKFYQQLLRNYTVSIEPPEKVKTKK